MFHFQRQHLTVMGSIEAYTILLASDPQRAKRFDHAVRVKLCEDKYFEIGNLLAVHGTESTEFLLAVRTGLTEQEKQQLVKEVELLFGREVHECGEETDGWFLRGAVASS